MTSEVMRELWLGAGLEDVETRVITVQRTFSGFDDYWTTILKGPSVAAKRMRDHAPWRVIGSLRN